jgi:hypothetical protein
MPTKGHEQTGRRFQTKSEAVVCALIAGGLLARGGGNRRVSGLVMAGPSTE